MTPFQKHVLLEYERKQQEQQQQQVPDVPGSGIPNSKHAAHSGGSITERVRVESEGKGDHGNVEFI